MSPPEKTDDKDRGHKPEKSTPEKEQISFRDEDEHRRAEWRAFPGPGGMQVPLRVSVERAAYSQLVAHAHESLDAEVCGVLAGKICEDDEGLFVDVQATVRGSAVRQGSFHVTYTHETWNAIHQELEQKYPELLIVGWYHTHPGLGVEFSDMDFFIQKNFFGGRAQVALLMDPLGGEAALAVNGPDGIQYVDRFWVGGREKRCFIPREVAKQTSSAGSPGETTRADLEPVEARLTQLVKAVDDLRHGMYRMLTGLSMFVGLGLMALIGYGIYSLYARPLTPPEMQQFANIPVRIGDKTYLVGVAIVGWPVPAELLPQLRELKDSPAGMPDGGQPQEAKPAVPRQPGGDAPPQAGPPSPEDGQSQRGKDGTRK